MSRQAAPYVVYISVDGLRTGDETQNLQTLIDAGLLPAFARLQAQGAWTHDARTDPFHTNTIPNHSTMLTGRPVEDATGAPGHRYRNNTDTDEFPDVPAPGVNLSTLHTSAGEYIPSVLNVAHDNGYSTAIYASKTKFSLYDDSYDGVDSPNDPAYERTAPARDTTGPDDGFDKLDRYFQNGNVALVIDRLVADAARGGLADFNFVHIRFPDSAGHDTGWGSPEYLAAIQASDVQLGRILELVESQAAYDGNTFLILTADHGGGGDEPATDTNHATPVSPLNFTIPFYVWGPGVAAGADLYALNPDRRVDPAADVNPQQVAVDRPIRNGDGGNLALDLLGLPAVPTSTLNAPQDLNAFPVTGVFGTAAADTLTGDAENDGLNGEAGDDTLDGAAGADTLDGGGGDDRLEGGAGNDRVNGGEGVDTASYATATAGVTVSLLLRGAQDTRGAGVDRLIAVENLVGGAGADRLVGDGFSNRLEGGAGNDTLNGVDGVDVLVGGAGRDLLIGGAGVDAADYRDRSESISVTLKGAADALVTIGGVAEDVLRGVERVFGGSGRDVLRGDDADNYFSGGGGDDALSGGGGADLLIGGAGVDRVDYRDRTESVVVTLSGGVAARVTIGGVGEDTLRDIEIVLGGSADDTLGGDALANTFRGYRGADRLTGGGGMDTFTYGDIVDSTVDAGGRDTVTDFSRSDRDRIDLRAIDAKPGTAADDAFALVAAFSGVAGQLVITNTGGDERLVEGDVSGDGVADFAILVLSAAALAAPDFML